MRSLCRLVVQAALDATGREGICTVHRVERGVPVVAHQSVVPGGVGTTRLAVEVGWGIAERYPDRGLAGGVGAGS